MAQVFLSSLKPLFWNILKNLALTYPQIINILNPSKKISEEEYEDSYKRFFREEIPPMVSRSKAFHIPWPINSRSQFAVTNASLPVKELKKLATVKGVSINDYMVSAYMFVLQEVYSEVKSYRKNKKMQIHTCAGSCKFAKYFPL